MLTKINETATYLKSRLQGELPTLGIIMGTGLGPISELIEDKQVIPYSEIPNFPVSTVEGHSGNLIVGNLAGKRVVGMQGRFHYYEGYDMKQVTFPVRVMKALGVETLIVSNASGGMNKEFRVGDVMVITDHINFFPEHPLRGKNYNELGTRFPAMTEAYSKQLVALADQIADEQQMRLMHGVYIGVTGPTFETPAEYGAYHALGADAVGMSTVPEVIVANHAGMKVFGISVITDLGGKDITDVPTHEEVQKAAVKAQPTVLKLVHELVGRI